MEEKLNKKRLVVPGEFIADVREVIPGEGTYVLNGKVYSLFLGELIYDSSKHLVSVKPIKYVIYPKKGDIVLGEIISAGATTATMKILFIVRKINDNPEFTILHTPFSGLIHISQIGVRTDNVSKILKSGDKVLGIITVSKTSPLGVSLIGEEFGVVAANCSKCGTALVKQLNVLMCPRCKKQDPRKMSSLYAYEKFTALFHLYKGKRYMPAETE